MSTPAGLVTAVRWSELCPWLLLVRAARIALLVRVILLAMLGVWMTQWGWAAIERMLLPGDAGRLEWLTDEPITSLSLPDGRVRVDSGRLGGLQPFHVVDDEPLAGPLIRGWAWAIQPLTRLAFAPTWRSGLAMFLAGVWVMAVWALMGGAICRIAALYLARGEILGPVAALQSAALKWPSTFAAPAFCFGVIAIFVAMLMVLGLVMRVGVFAFLAALVWPAALALGFAIAVFALGLLVGWPLMWSTVAAERTDAFDAVSRGYAFAYQRPLHLAFFVLVATVLGVLAHWGVSLIVNGALHATHAAVGAGLGIDEQAALMRDFDTTPEDDENDPGAMTEAAGELIRFWSRVLASVASSFPMAYLWPAAMAMYLLLRRLIDSTETGELAIDDGGPQSGLPTLVKDPATGVPTVQSAAAPATAPTPIGVPAVEPTVPTPGTAPPATVTPLPPGDATSTVTELRGGPS